ncbi:OmpH family outer membrane protein [bacterium]|nr:OmpH family outer membrane protein [bacterium]
MRKYSKFIAVIVTTILAIGTTNNIAISSPSNFKYAVVDVQKVVASSKQVNALKTEQNAKMRELSQFIQNANKQLQAESDATKKQALETKLNKELVTKRNAIEKKYAESLKKIDENISSTISKTAKQSGYDLVLAKGIVLYSTGTDITEEIIKVVK